MHNIYSETNPGPDLLTQSDARDARAIGEDALTEPYTRQHLSRLLREPATSAWKTVGMRDDFTLIDDAEGYFSFASTGHHLRLHHYQKLQLQPTISLICSKPSHG